MSVTVDCGEGKHGLCTGRGRTAYLFPQESRERDEPPFNCGCWCHHHGVGVPCKECAPDSPQVHAARDEPGKAEKQVRHYE